jgi:hypothetical protein
LNTFQKQFKLARNLLSKVFFVLLGLSFQRNRQYYYGRYLGSDHTLLLVIKNILRPKRIIKKFLYGQIVRIPFIFSAANQTEGLPELADEWQEYIEILRRDGIVFIPDFFKKSSEALNDSYKLNAQEFPPKDEYYHLDADFNNLDIFNITVDSMMLTILAKYYGCQPYLRQQPFINCTHLGTAKDSLETRFNYNWHYDTVNQTTAHVLLTNVSESDSCMFYAKGSHRTHREYISKNDYFYSEEYMNNNFEIIPCIGKSGTLVIFDSNGLHRVDLKPNTFRALLHLNFLPGKDVEQNSKVIQADFSNITKSELLKLKEYQVGSLSHTYPRSKYWGNQ